VSLEQHFDVAFATALALKEKQIQQNYRPIIGIHKWFARRPGTIFRNLLLAEFNGHESLDTSYWRTHQLRGVIADPFMGGGTPVVEANRLGFSVVGADVNPMAHWIVRQSLSPLDLAAFQAAAALVVADTERQLADLYRTRCLTCGKTADVKYFLWVKTETCPACGTANDLFPGYLLAAAERHPRHVVACAGCGALNEYEEPPTRKHPARCGSCRASVAVEGPAQRQRVECRHCGLEYQYPQPRLLPQPPAHRLWALEYYCERCKPDHAGRFFKAPDQRDLARVRAATKLLAANPSLTIPGDAIPNGDETARLHRWGYGFYRDMFNERQLFGLGTLLARIRQVPDAPVRHALLTVFSDCLRYQNMLCRYDTYALKCQDIFSVHGFPVGLVQCENNLLGIPCVGSGSFRHFVEKYLRAKRYCTTPFETRQKGGRKETVRIEGERIGADLVDRPPAPDRREAWLVAGPATQPVLAPHSLDGVFTDPPYFDNIQYAELMDFCYVWLRLGLQDDFVKFRKTTTRTPEELTGNATLGRGLDHFTAGLSAVFRHYAAALKPGAPFVFTYHHNVPAVYAPLVVAILDAGLDCTATLPAAAEMSASLHIAGTGSSVLDSVFVCRRDGRRRSSGNVAQCLAHDLEVLRPAMPHLSEGDVRCLAAGHLARVAVNRLHAGWNPDAPLVERLAQARESLDVLTREQRIENHILGLVGQLATSQPHGKEARIAKAV
jgi:adenine-specific DNA methylase